MLNIGPSGPAYGCRIETVTRCDESLLPVAEAIISVGSGIHSCIGLAASIAFLGLPDVRCKRDLCKLVWHRSHAATCWASAMASWKAFAGSAVSSDG